MSEGRLGAFSVLSRRRLLQVALGGGALLAGGTGGLLALRGTAPTVEGLRNLSAHEHRTLAALARTHLPAGGPFAPGADDFELARAFDAFLDGEPAANVADLKRALLLLEWGPLVFEHRLTTFSNLDPAARERHFEAWMTSPRLLQRQVALAFRKFLSLVYFDRPEVWPHLGYPGPMVRP